MGCEGCGTVLGVVLLFLTFLGYLIYVTFVVPINISCEAAADVHPDSQTGLSLD